MRKVLILLVSVSISMVSFAQTHWKIDPIESSISFKVANGVFTLFKGNFIDYTGNGITYGEKLEDSKIDFTVQVTSINTNNEERDIHLRSADFFEVEIYPTMIFESTKVLATGKADCYQLHGKLTIKDVTKDVVYDAYYLGTVENEGRERIFVEARTTINRFDYNINYNPAGFGFGKKIHITVCGQFVKQ